MPIVYIALGSNLGDRYSTLSAAVRRLRAEPGLRLIASSEVYETAPVNCPPESGAYLNSVVAVETDRSPEDLLQLLHRIEHAFGRVRGEINAPRTLDLDLLLYGDRVINTPDLVIPHPRMHERAFVLAPLLEVAGSAGDDHVQQMASDHYSPILANTAELEQLPRMYFDKRPHPLTLLGLRALVTGSTSGIGATISGQLQHLGAEVINHGRRSRLNPAEKFVSADLRDIAQVDRLVNEAWDLAGGLDVLVCNAGADTLTGEAGKWSFDDKLEALISIDLKATMRLARTVGARMKERGSGSIITIGWDQAETGMEGDSGQLFAAVKGAVMCFTRSLALSLAPEVRVNCIAPGWIRTAWGETASTAWQERVRKETPLGVWGLPEDVALAAVWLASPAARFITGQTIRVNGGAVR